MQEPFEIEPLGDRVIVSAIHEEEKKSGIIIPETAQRDKPQRAIVVAVGETDKLEVGNIIYFGRFGGSEIRVNDQPYLVLRVDDILGRAR